MNGTATPPPVSAGQTTAESQAGGPRPRSRLISGLLVAGVFCAFLVFLAGLLTLIYEPIGLSVITPPDDKGIDRMLTVVGRQLNFVSLFVACFSLFMAITGIFINKHFKEFGERQKEFDEKQKKLDETHRDLRGELGKIEGIRNEIRGELEKFKAETTKANQDRESKVRILSQEATIFNAEFVLSTLLPDPCSTQQIPVEMTYVLHQFQRLIDEFVKDDLDERLKGNGALIKFAQALHRYGVKADDLRAIELLEQALSNAKSEMAFKILYRLGICYRQHRRWQDSILTFRKLRRSCEDGGCFARYRVLANLGEAITWLAWRAHLIDHAVWDENILSQVRNAYAEEQLHSFLPILHGQSADAFARDEKNHVAFCERFLQNSYECAFAAWKLHSPENGTTRPPPLLLTYYLTKILYFMTPDAVRTVTTRIDAKTLWIEPARTGLNEYQRLENVSTTERVDPFMALNYRLCLIYVHLCDCRHFVPEGEKTSKEAEVQKMIINLQKDSSGDKLSTEAKAVKERIPSFEPTIYSEHFEREVDISAFAAEIAKLA